MDDSVLGRVGGECLARPAGFEEEINHQGFPFFDGMGVLPSGLSAHNGGTSIDCQEFADSGNIHHAAVRNDAGINCAVAVMQGDARGTDEATRIVISRTRPIGSYAAQASAGRDRGVALLLGLGHLGGHDACCLQGQSHAANQNSNNIA